MYYITEMLDGTFCCEVRIQDGTERWFESTRIKAIRSVIKGARTMNHDYITEKDITIQKEIVETTYPYISPQDLELLQKIKSGYKVILDFDDPRIRYKITKEDCELIIKIREGDVQINTSTNS